MNETTSYSCTILISFCTWCVLPGLALSPCRPSLDLPVFIMKDRGPGDTASSANFIHTYLTMSDCTYSLARQPYEGGIVAERDGQVPRLRPRGGGSVNETTKDRLCARSLILFIFANADSVDVTSVQLTNRYVISVTIM